MSFSKFHRSGFCHFDIRTELVYDLILRDGQSVLFRFVDASIVLIEVQDVRKKKRGFLANVGNGFLHILIDEPSQIDRLDSGNCLKQSVRHGDAESFWLLRTKDGQNELNNPPPSLVRQFPRWNLSLGSWSPLNFLTYKPSLRLAHPSPLHGVNP